MKGLILIILSLLVTRFVSAQVAFNNNDSLYYTDSTYEKLANGVIGYIDTNWTSENSYVIPTDSTILIFNNGILISKVAKDLKHNFISYSSFAP